MGDTHGTVASDAGQARERPAAVPADVFKGGLGRRLAPALGLAAVIVGLCAYVILATAGNIHASQEHHRTLTINSMFAEARVSIAGQENHLRQFRAERKAIARERFLRGADMTETLLAQVRDIAAPSDRAAAGRLHVRGLRYRESATRLMDMIENGDPETRRMDEIEVTAVYNTLQHDIDRVSQEASLEVHRQADALREAQTHMLIGTSAGFLLGLIMVGAIWQLVLGYQHRLIEQAAASRHQALHDPLTGLPNRVLFTDRVRAALKDGQVDRVADHTDRDDRSQVALLVIDLNGFKVVNDTLGHAAGDQLLVEAGHRLAQHGRRGDIVARLGGDEFAVLLPDIPDLRTAYAVGERMADALSHDFLLDNGPAAVSGSIGIALSPLHGGEDDLFRFADAAMYQAKALGGGVAIYDASLDAELPNRMTLFAELRALLDAGDPDGQLRLYYQPQVRISDGTVTGLEALVRWQHPERGLLMPKDFLPIAETRGLEVPLTYHLLRVAVRQTASWHAAGRELTVAVNISPRCLLDPEFVAQVRGILAAHLLPPRLLRLEITETSIMTDPDRAVAAVLEVHASGVSISVDDFGTGFSSLAQLKRLPTDELKIDQMFIREMRPGSEDELVVRSSIELAHNMGLWVVAEGVEELTVLTRLAELSCDYAQGFGLSRPVPVAEVEAACAKAQAHARSAIPQHPPKIPATSNTPA